MPHPARIAINMMAVMEANDRPHLVAEPAGELADWITGHRCSRAPRPLLLTVLASSIVDTAAREWSIRKGRARLAAEAAASMEVLGPSVRALLSSHLRQLIGAARAGNGPLAVQLAKGVAASLATPATAGAALDDLVAAVADPLEAPENVEWRRNLVADISGVLNLSWRALSRRAAGILADRALDVAAARYSLGVESDPWIGNSDQPAGLAWDERLDLAKRTLLSPLEPAHHVVWLAIDRARVNFFPSVGVGAVDFFHLDVVRRALQGDRSRLPPELARTGSVSASELPEEGDMMLARVDLGVVAVDDPVDRARTLLSDLLALVSFEVDLSGRGVWRIWSGHWYAIDGQVSEWGRFEIRDDLDVYREAYEAVGSALLAMARDSGQDPTRRAVGFRQVVSWLEQAIRADPAMASMLYVRVIESLIATTGDTDWQRFADQYFQRTWIRYQIGETIASLLRRSTRWLSPVDMRLEPEQRAALDAVSRAVFKWLPGRYEADLRSAVEHLSTLAAALPRDSALGREVRALQAMLHSLDALQGWIRALGRDWHLLTTRLNQVRNEVAHTAHPSITMAETTLPIGAFLASQVAFQSAEALAGVKSLEVSCQSVRQAADLWFDYIPTAPNVAMAVAGPEIARQVDVLHHPFSEPASS